MEILLCKRYINWHVYNLWHYYKVRAAYFSWNIDADFVFCNFDYEVFIEVIDKAIIYIIIQHYDHTKTKTLSIISQELRESNSSLWITTGSFAAMLCAKHTSPLKKNLRQAY